MNENLQLDTNEMRTSTTVRMIRTFLPWAFAVCLRLVGLLFLCWWFVGGVLAVLVGVLVGCWLGCCWVGCVFVRLFVLGLCLSVSLSLCFLWLVACGLCVFVFCFRFCVLVVVVVVVFLFLGGRGGGGGGVGVYVLVGVCAYAWTRPPNIPQARHQTRLSADRRSLMFHIRLDS